MNTCLPFLTTYAANAFVDNKVINLGLWYVPLL
jgi:hypothetical protein